MYTQIMSFPLAGYREIDHTADWSLVVWAPTLSELFECAVSGMYALSATRMAADEDLMDEFLELEGVDLESLLVNFLTELLFLGEEQGKGALNFDLAFSKQKLKAKFKSAKIIGQEKEIKAVTYHGLEITQGVKGYEVTIVFDV